MEKNYILVVDEGTTTVRSILFDRDMNTVGLSKRELALLCLSAGEVEQDPLQIYEYAVVTMREAVKAAGIAAQEIAAVGITNQRGTWALWNRSTGEPITNMITWMDTRSEKSRAFYSTDRAFSKLFPNQLTILPPWNFILTFHQLLKKRPELEDAVKRADTCFGTIDTWLIYKFTAGKVFAVSASSDHSGPFYARGEMDEREKVRNLFSMHENTLPEIREESDDYGMLDEEILGVQIPICGNIADQQASLFSQGCIKAGSAKCTGGTGAFVNVNIGDRFITNHIVTSYTAWSMKGKRVNCVEGVAGNAGTCLEWAKNSLQIIKSFETMENEALEAGDNGGVYFIPALAGMECANFLDPAAKGAFVGLTLATSRKHMIRAVLESIGYAISNVFFELRKLNFTINSIFMDGGVSKSDMICQMIANITGAQVVRSKVMESTAMGAAEMAAIRLGWMTIDDVPKYAKAGRTFIENQRADSDRIHFTQWRDQVKKALRQDGD